MGEEEGKLSYSAEMDDSAFVRGMNNIRESVHETANEVKQTGMTVDEFTGEMNKLLGSFEKMTAAVNRNTAAQEQVARAGKKAGEEEQRGAEKATEAIQKTTTATKELGTEFEQTSGMMTQGMDKLTKAAAGFLTLQASKDFVQKVTSIRGEFQKLEVAFTTMLGSGERAQQLMQELTRTAAITPFDLKGVADGAKQLLAYGVAAENVNDTLIHLGDIAAGLSIPLGDLVMLYGTTMTQGRMFTQDLRQFMGRDIPLAEELAKQFGVTKDKVGELVTAGKVGAEEFNKAIMSMSSEGGKFAGLMEAQSHTIAGQISNIEDAIDTMFNEIGKSNEGIINDVLGSVSYLVENYKKVGAVLMDAVVAIGLYKTALITAHAIEKTSIAIKQAMAVQEALLTAEAKKLAAAHGISIAAAKAELGSVNVLTVAKMRLTAATKALTASMLANPYTAVAVALAAVAFGVYKLATAEGVETAARRRANEEMQTFADKFDEQQNKIKGYIHTIQDETATEYQKAVAWEMLNKMAPTLTEKYDKATIATLDLAEATKELNEQADKANYDHVRSEVQKWKEAIERINQNMFDDARYTGGKNAIFNLQQLADAEAQLDTYLKKLAEIDRIRKKMAEDAKPLEIRIKEANENVHAKQSIYDFYKRAADLAGELKNAHDIAAGTIANSNIPYNYETIADQTKEKYDALIAELEADVEDLRTRIAESPASLELEQELKGKEKALDDLISMKQQWAWSGATTIPLNFVMNFSQVETALQNAKNGQGINTQGMRFNGPTGTWVKDEATAPAPMTASQWRKDAYNNWKQAQAAVDAFWNKKEEMDKATFDKEYKALKDAADKAKKDYDKLKGDSSRSNAAKKAAETARQHQAYLDLIERNKVERERAAKDLEFSTEQATIDALEDGTEKTLRQLKLNFEKQKAEIERGYKDLKQAKIDEAKKLWEANPANKNKLFDASTVDTLYTDEEKANYEALMEANNAAYRRALEERRRMEAQAMLDYIKEYGEMQERKAAVSKEYDEKIERESEVWRKAALERARDAIIQQLDMEALSKEIDWESIFGHLDIVSTDALKKLREQLKSALKAGDVDAQNAKVLAEKIREIEETITERTDVWASILPPLQKRKQLIEQTAEAQRVLNALYDDETDKMLAQQKARSSILSMLTSATGKLYTVGDLQGMDKEQFMSILGYGGDLSKASDEVRAKAEGASKAFDRLTQTTTDLNAASEKRTRQEKVRDALNNAGGDGDLGKALGAMFGGMSFTEIIEAIDTNVQSLRGLVDRTGASDTDFGTAVNAFADGVGGFTGAVKSLLNLDVIGAVNGILDGIAGFARMGITSIFGVGNVERMEERIAALSRSQEILAASIDGLSKQIENSSATYEESTEAYREALKVEEEWEEKQREKIEARSGEYANTGYGFLNLAGKGSFGAHVAEELRDWSGWDTFSEVLKRHGSESVVKSWGDFMHLTPEEMELLKTFAPKEWERLFDTDGHANPKELVDEYIERAGMTESLSNALLKKVTGYDFEGYLDAWKSLLKDLDSSTEDFAEHVNETIANAVLDNLVNGMFAKRIKNLQKLMADFAEGGYDERELEIIRGNAEMLAQDMQRERQRLIDSGVIQVPVEASGLDEMRDQLRSALLDMTGDAEAWGDNVRRIMFEALADDYVFSNPAYTEWLEGWEKRYSEVMDDHMLTQAERDEKLRQLQKEQEKGFEEWRDTIQSCADAVGYSTDSLEEDFSDMVDSIMDAMTDSSESVEDWAKSFRERILHEYIQQFLFTEEDLSHIRDNVGAVMEIMQDAMLTDEQRQAQSQPYLDAIEQYVAEGKEAYARLSDLWQIVTPEESPFSGLRETFADALVGMEDDAKAFRKRLDETLVRDLIDKNVLGSSFTAALDGAETAFSDFDDYVSKWNEKYIAAVASGDMSAIDRLMSELEHVYRDKMDASESYLERIRDAEEDITFSGMTDNWVSALMDMDVTAEDWAQEVGHRMAEKVITEMVGASMLQPLLDDLQAAFDDTKTWSQDFEGFVRNPEIQEALTAIKEAFPEYQSVAKEIMEAFGVNMSGNGGFSDLRGTFVSTLMDMDADAESFGKNIGKTMIEQMADAYLETNFKDIMKSVNEEWAEALSSGDASKLDEVRRKVEELYTAIGNDDVIKKLRNDLKELSESLSTPLDDIRSSFLSSLMDLDAKTEDYARSIADTFTEAFIDEFVLGDMFDQQLESWKKQFAGIMSDESMDSEERARQLKELKNLIADYRDQMSEEARAIQDLMGTSSYEDQQATMNMSDKATYEQMDRYLGVQMATLMATEQGNIVRQQILSTLQSMDGIASPDGNIAREVRGLMIVANGYLLDIKRSNRDILSQFGAKLDSISSKLSRIL